MSLESKTLSWWDSVCFHALITLPSGVLGLVVPHRIVLMWFARWDLARKAARFVAGLQRKYGCGHLWLWFPKARTLLVLDSQSIDAVLGSADNAADPWLKKRALSRFVPDALVISSDAPWADRRPFNETVLAFARPLPDAEVFKGIAFEAVASWPAARERRLRWSNFQQLALHISHQVILGAGEVRPDIAEALGRMAYAGNALLRLPRDFAAFFTQINDQLQRHRRTTAESASSGQSGPVPQSCLVHRAAALLDDGTATSLTCVPSQMGFWFFVLKDALELHVARTLALIAAHADIQDRVRREVAQWPGTADTVPGDMRLLEACIREQLRLWTPVPILLRRAARDFALRDAIAVKSEQQLLMLTSVYHRDAAVYGASADRFTPEVRAAGSPATYVFSAGRQSCAGQFLAMFMLKATLAALLKSYRFELVAPRLQPERIPYLFDHFGIELRVVGEGVPAA
jgi:cytochrome P450